MFAIESHRLPGLVVRRISTNVVVLALMGGITFSAGLLAADIPAVPSNDKLPLITPYNFDPADPGEYSRRGGVLSPGFVATGRVWNRPLPRLRRTIKTAHATPLLPPPVTISAAPYADMRQAKSNSDLNPIEPLVTPDESAPRLVAAAASAAPRIARSTGLASEPSVQARQVGTSVLGLPIVGHFFGVTGPKTLIFAAIHGDEPNTAFVANRLVEHLTHHPDAYFARRVLVVPVANPDGLARGTRANAREIDLNRNFPAKNFTVGKKGRYFGGEQPGSEPESQMLMQLIDDWQPHRIVTLHAIARGRHGNNFDGPAEELAKIMSRHNAYAVLKTMNYPTPGSFGSWAGIDRQIPTITLELPADASGPTAWRENREALLSVIQAK